MSSTDRLAVLRERNKDLLKQLKQQREELERLSGCSQSRKREREDEAEERTEPVDILTITDGDRGPARAALAKPTVRFADTCERQTDIQGTIPALSLTSKYREGTTEHTTLSDLFNDSNRHPLVHSRLQDTRPASTKSCLLNHSKKQREVQSQVTFQSDECEAIPATDRHHLQPLLGYDWIAGVLDAEDSLIERSDEFFNDLRTFRSLNKDECVHRPQAEFSEENHSILPPLTAKDSPEATTDSHQCTFSYRINSRLFPVPLHSQECCPVCKKHKSSHPHTTAEPALIRVSIPRSTLLPAYKYKAHRRCSFDPSDSLGLPSHCLSGWSNTGQSMLPPPSSLDLRSSLNMKSSTEEQTKELEVCSVPYQADSDGNCLDPNKEYRSDDANVCCKKCPPGQRLTQECTLTTETECEPCSAGLYMENWNFATNCRSCPKCRSHKGLREAQSCSSTTRSKCVCLPGMYCEIGGEDCTACTKYKTCKVGYGVSVPGTGNSDVRCEWCPNGTFSDTISSTDRCQPHTDCHGRVVVKKGDAKSDTVCGSEATISIMQSQTSTKEPRTETVFAPATTVMSTVSATPDSKAPRGLTDSTQSTNPSVSEAVFNYSTKSPPPSTVPDGTLAAVIAGVTGFILLLIAVILLVLCKPIWKKDAARFHPKVDANGNCETGDKINLGYLGETQITSFTVTSPEQQCLLQNGEACSDHSQSSNNTETLTRTDGCSSEESIGPLQSTVLYNPLSALSEPMTLLSNTEPISPQLSVPTQPSSQSFSQPTSPQVISPVTTSPHVNVNITFNIGNGTCGTPTVTPTDSMQANSKLPFGEEEESYSIPQQEAGKQSLMSVQESESYSA